MKKLVIGLGSGRCGTVSLRDLLIHIGFNATHELHLMPWNQNYDLCDNIIKKILTRASSLVSDIGYYYLPYIPHIIKNHKNVKCICLQRDVNEVIDSFLKFSKYNYWSTPYINREETEWDETFPTYPNKSKSDAIRLYWEEYYNTASLLTKEYPDNIHLFDMNKTLNTEIGQKELFDFIEFTGPIKLGIKRHMNHPNRQYKYI